MNKNHTYLIAGLFILPGVLAAMDADTGLQKTSFTAQEYFNWDPTAKRAKRELMHNLSHYLRLGKEAIIIGQKNVLNEHQRQLLKKLLQESNNHKRDEYFENLNFYDHVQTLLALSHATYEMWCKKINEEKLQYIIDKNYYALFQNVFFDAHRHKDFFNWLEGLQNWKSIQAVMSAELLNAIQNTKKAADEPVYELPPANFYWFFGEVDCK